MLCRVAEQSTTLGDTDNPADSDLQADSGLADGDHYHDEQHDTMYSDSSSGKHYGDPYQDLLDVHLGFRIVL